MLGGYTATDLLSPGDRDLLHEAEKQLADGGVHKAINVLETLRTRYPADVDVLNALGACKLVSGCLREAVEYFHTVLERRPDHEGAMENLRDACRARLSDGHPSARIKYDLNIPDLKRPLCGVPLFEGWAFSEDGIERIQVMLNGDFLCDADLGIPRPDVARAYGASATSARSGFRFYINTVVLANGVHELALRIITKTGIHETAQLLVAIANESFSEQEQELLSRYCANRDTPVLDKSIMLPSYFSLETTVGCPSSCIMCPRERIKATRRNVLLPERLVDKVLDEVDWPALINWEWINDPLCDPRIYGFMKRAKNRGFQNWITTTGQLLDEYHSHKLLESNLDVLVFSVDTLDARLYKAIRRGGDLEDVLHNIARFMELKQRLGGNTNVWITKIQLPLTRHEDPHRFAEYFSRMGIHKIQHPSYRFRGGAFDADPSLKHIIPNRMQCYYLENEMAITTDGNVMLCACEAGAWDEPEANIENMSIRDAWLTPRRIATIQLVRSKGLRAFSACREHEDLSS